MYETQGWLVVLSPFLSLTHSLTLSLFFFSLSPLLLFVLVARQHLADVGCARAHTLVHATTVHVSLCAGYCGYYIAINGTSQCNLQGPRLSSRTSFFLPFVFILSLSLSLSLTRAPFPPDFQASIPSFSGKESSLRLIVLCSRYICRTCGVNRRAMGE